MWSLYHKFKNVVTVVEHCLESVSGNLPPTCVHARSVAKSCWWYLPNLSLPHLPLLLPSHFPSSDLHLDHSQRPLMCPCPLSLLAPIHLTLCLLLTPATLVKEKLLAPHLYSSQLSDLVCSCKLLIADICISVPRGFFPEPQVERAKELVSPENNPPATMEGKQMDKCPSSLSLRWDKFAVWVPCHLPEVPVGLGASCPQWEHARCHPLFLLSFPHITSLLPASVS